jgi:peptidoglycan/xylan/chitin deacetylase (PgdA/CDA1 family)
MFYFVSTPFLIKKIFPNLIWSFSGDNNTIYLTFDDGPHPQITPFVLEELKKYKAKATFFCIGKNVALYPDVYARIIEEGHAVGNHTYTHMNGYKSADEDYLEDIYSAKKIIDSNLFRPPYGRITRFQQSCLKQPRYQLKTIMWSVLSGDFDQSITKEKCLKNVLYTTKKGSIVVFHDSEKAAEKMMYALPEVLKYFSEKGFGFDSITEKSFIK